MIMHPADIVHPYTVQEHDLNGYGIMHGGRMLTLCDEVSYLAARHHAGSACLTRAVHRARFLQGADIGELLTIRAKVGMTGKTSLWVPVEISSNTGQEVIMDAIFVFVAINDKHQPLTVSPLLAKTLQEKETLHRLQMLQKQLVQTH